MLTIEEELRSMLESCPVLLDERFQEEYPGIIGVAAFLDASAKTHYALSGGFAAFDRVGVHDITDYVRLIQENNPEALRTYRRIKDILCL
ncbi:MAG: hypothetical protein PHH00_01535 [Candidatus Nanoarchaeia archaeon]|nr:hypothetical protein [Candidatus Nanoarchaeia archaeon]